MPELAVADDAQSHGAAEQHHEGLVDLLRRAIPHLGHGQRLGAVLGVDGDIAGDQIGDRYGGPTETLGVEDLAAIGIRFDEAGQAQTDADQTSPRAAVAFAERLDGLLQVGGDAGKVLTLVSSAEFAVDAVHREVEQLDGYPAFADVGAEEKRAGWVGREQGDRSAAPGGDYLRFHHESLGDEFGH